MVLAAIAGVLSLGNLAIALAAEPKPDAAKAIPPANLVRPAKAPEYTGVVEKFKVYPSPAPIGRPVTQVLVRMAGAVKQADLIWVHLDKATLEQDGSLLEVGSVVSIWSSGGVGKTHPPQVWPTYILCQPAKQ